VEHFLTALNLQQQAKGPVNNFKERKMSESIWSTLKLAVSMSDKQDLLPQVTNRDLTSLLAEFGVN